MRIILIAALALAACGQAAKAPEAQVEAAPPALMDQVVRMAPEQQPVFAWQQLTAYQQAHPEAAPACTSIRGAESRGTIPADVDPTSGYAAHVGSLVYSVQCGPQLTTVRDDPREHWLVAFAPGATEVAVTNCAGPQSRDMCPRAIPRAAGAAAAP